VGTRHLGSHNTAPEGAVSGELLSAQVKAKVATTHAVEELFFQSMRLLELGLSDKFGIVSHDIDDKLLMSQVFRFHSKNQGSLLLLEKELVHLFSDRLNIRDLRMFSTHAEKEKLGSNKLLQDILSQKIGAKKTRQVFARIAGAYDMCVSDAYPIGSKIADAIKLAGIGQNRPHLRQREQLIHNFGQAI
jgi:hypothetical protein